MKRGDVIIVDFPYGDLTGSKRRPALILQADALNQVRADTILALITSTYAGRIAEVLVDVAQEPGSGLKFNSSVQCDTLVTLDQSFIVRIVGSLSATTMTKVDTSPRSALSL
jgi:mRNA interferase MazF